ncbi:GntR family transcriptional regulator [Thalassolituus hydrocarboniclasticus]|uniref:GntR family transcriptional regulator n=1 Tax=Thalassolituus hydrocarboniclasticus TaxID=2742796 RepID=UPI0021B58E5F|nr:GntR family transcriptional regulator [Thalassolituus hydrocarboniclasticus]
MHGSSYKSEASENKRPLNLAERIYQQLKNDIFDFQLLPGDRFSENEIARRMQASRTPVREALYRLERDGFVQVHFRSGWQVRPFDFRYFEDLYDVRTLLEVAAVKRLCGHMNIKEQLAGLITLWCCQESQRLNDSTLLAEMDEDFHFSLLELSGNQEMAAIHRMVCERLRIIRRLDFTQEGRIAATYDEHSHILNLMLNGNAEDAANFLSRHIEISKNTVRHITLHRIQSAKSRYNINIRAD